MLIISKVLRRETWRENLNGWSGVWLHSLSRDETKKSAYRNWTMTMIKHGRDGLEWRSEQLKCVWGDDFSLFFSLFPSYKFNIQHVAKFIHFICWRNAKECEGRDRVWRWRGKVVMNYAFGEMFQLFFSSSATRRRFRLSLNKEE